MPEGRRELRRRRRPDVLGRRYRWRCRLWFSNDLRGASRSERPQNRNRDHPRPRLVKTTRVDGVRRRTKGRDAAACHERLEDLVQSQFLRFAIAGPRREDRELRLGTDASRELRMFSEMNSDLRQPTEAAPAWRSTWFRPKLGHDLREIHTNEWSEHRHAHTTN